MLARFTGQLKRLDAYVYTINAFPYGPFHGTPVKERVYLPDWRSPERLSFTADAAAILTQLLPDDGVGSISTVPGGFKAEIQSKDAIAAIIAGLTAMAAKLVRIAQVWGPVITLALEPEPACLLETVDETIAFFTKHLFGPAAVEQLAATTGLNPAAAAAALRRHLGVCYDVCHGSVIFEDPLRAISRLQAAGIRVAKIQLSAAIKVPAMTRHAADFPADARRRRLPAPDRFSRWNGGSPLRRPAGRSGSVRPRNRARRGAGALPCSAQPVAVRRRRHDAGRPARRPRRHARRPVVAASRGRDLYTWDVLPTPLRGNSKAEAIAAELRFVRQVLLRPADDRAA